MLLESLVDSLVCLTDILLDTFKAANHVGLTGGSGVQVHLEVVRGWPHRGALGDVQASNAPVARLHWLHHSGWSNCRFWDLCSNELLPDVFLPSVGNQGNRAIRFFEVIVLAFLFFAKIPLGVMRCWRVYLPCPEESSCKLRNRQITDTIWKFVPSTRQ